MSQVDIVGVQHYTPGIGHPKTSVDAGGAVVALNDDKQVVDSAGQVLGGGASLDYVGCWPMTNTTGHPNNIANASRQLLLRDEFSSAAAWANPGYLTAGTVSGEYAALVNRAFRWNMDTDSVIFSTVVNRPAPGSNSNFLGCCNTSSRYGFYLQARSGTGGKIRPFLTTTDGNFATLPDSRAVVCDDTDHSVTIMIDGPTKSVYLFVDGALDTAFQAYYTGGGDVTANLALGALQDTGTASTPVGGKFGPTHMLVFYGRGLPINAAEIAARIHSDPRRALAPQEVDTSEYSRIALAVAGQSNEQGSGNRVTSVSRVGGPITDPVGPFGQSTAMSMWPGVSETLGAQRKWLIMHNTARGSSSLPNHWLGRIMAWSAGARVAFGQYTIGSGRVFKATTVPSSTNGLTGGTEPTWPASGTVVDNTVTWTFVRNATAADTIGKIMSSSDDLFDPNGYVANITTRLQKLSTSIAERKVYLAFGQEDSTRNTSQADYASALVKFATYMTSLGFETHLGMSFYADTLDTQYINNLIPGLNDALSSLSNNPLVFAGVNMREVFGVLPVSPPLGTYGLKSDGLHVTDETYAAAFPLIAENVA